jgi:hypothetical protein
MCASFTGKTKSIEAMNQPIPRGGTEPLKVGDRVQIVPEWQDPGDDQYQRFVIEAPDDCTRVRIQAVVPGLFFQPVEWIEADHLLSLPANNQ